MVGAAYLVDDADVRCQGRIDPSWARNCRRAQENRGYCLGFARDQVGVTEYAPRR